MSTSPEISTPESVACVSLLIIPNRRSKGEPYSSGGRVNMMLVIVGGIEGGRSIVSLYLTRRGGGWHIGIITAM